MWFAYLGALYIRNGLPALKTWLIGLIDPDISAQPQQQYDYQPSQPIAAPPPLPPSSDPFANGIPLSIMNQTAVQKKVQVTYTQQQTGQPHLPTWTAQCHSKLIHVFHRQFRRLIDLCSRKYGKRLGRRKDIESRERIGCKAGLASYGLVGATNEPISSVSILAFTPAFLIFWLKL